MAVSRTQKLTSMNTNLALKLIFVIPNWPSSLLFCICNFLARSNLHGFMVSLLKDFSNFNHLKLINVLPFFQILAMKNFQVYEVGPQTRPEFRVCFGYFTNKSEIKPQVEYNKFNKKTYVQSRIECFEENHCKQIPGKHINCPGIPQKISYNICSK